MQPTRLDTFPEDDLYIDGEPRGNGPRCATCGDLAVWGQHPLCGREDGSLLVWAARDPVRDRLRELGRRRADGLEIVAAARAELVALLPDARDAGIDITEMAGLAGVTRQTVYDLLGRES